MKLDSILEKYGLNESEFKIISFGGGLINHTWKLSDANSEYILQRINHDVFKFPINIANNIRLIANYLNNIHPQYLFISPIKTVKGEELFYEASRGYFRLFPFVNGSISKDVVETSLEAYNAGVQFGKFTKLLSGIDINKIKITIPDFHNIILRYEQFLDALRNGNQVRIAECAESIEVLKSQVDIVEEYKKIKSNPNFKLRVTHHDTKISNILFDKKGEAICVIDLDTVMPGYFISDVGDMMRTYLSPVSEEEKDFSKIEIREDYYKAIVDGYVEEMKDELTDIEKQYFFYAAKFLIYMQALRFITDYINDDVYYGAKYAGHNLVRGKNQIVLLQKLLAKEAILSKY